MSSAVLGQKTWSELTTEHCVILGTPCPFSANKSLSPPGPYHNPTVFLDILCSIRLHYHKYYGQHSSRITACKMPSVWHDRTSQGQ